MVTNNGSTTIPTPKSDKASPRRRKFAVECKVEERKILIIIKRFPTMAAAEMMLLKMALMSKATSSASSKNSRGISITQDVLEMFSQPLESIWLLCLWCLLHLMINNSQTLLETGNTWTYCQANANLQWDFELLICSRLLMRYPVLQNEI